MTTTDPRDAARVELILAEFPEFGEALARGRVRADADVAARLYDRAVGFESQEMHVSNSQGEITLTPIRRYHPPDTHAATWWLKNRQPRLWRDRVEHTGADGEAITIKLVKFNEKEPLTIEHQADEVRGAR